MNDRRQRCAVASCFNCNGSKKNGQPVKFHRLPVKSKNKEYFNSWKKFCHREDENLNWVSARICSVHFSPECYDPNYKSGKLKRGSLPTLFGVLPPQSTNIVEMRGNSNFVGVPTPTTTTATRLPYNCPTCPKTFYDFPLMTEHLKVIHKFSRIYNCKYCGLFFRGVHQLQEHERVGKCQKKGPSILKPKGKKGVKKVAEDGLKLTLYREHPKPEQECQKRKRQKLEKIHEEVIPDHLKLPCCPKQEKRTKKQTESEVLEATGDLKLSCCPKQKKQTKKQTESEVLEATGDLKLSFGCPKCFELFTDFELWKEHIDTHDTGRTYKCAHCNKTFDSHKDLERHEREDIFRKVRKEEAPDQPKQVGYAKEKPDWQKQLQEEEEKIERVKQLMEVTVGNENVNKKKTEQPESVLQEKTEEPVSVPEEDPEVTEFSVKCEVCKKRCPDIEELMLHSSIHRGLMSLECELCGNSFYRNDHMIKEEKDIVYLDMFGADTQQDVWPAIFPCPKCDALYPELKLLEEHLEDHKKRRKICESCKANNKEVKVVETDSETSSAEEEESEEETISSPSSNEVPEIASDMSEVNTSVSIEDEVAVVTKCEEPYILLPLKVELDVEFDNEIEVTSAICVEEESCYQEETEFDYQEINCQ